MTDRIPLDHLTSDALDALYEQLAALRAVARGYCPECGRGDAGPTAEHWEQQRKRADEAEAQLRLVDAMRQQNLDAAAAATQRAETAEAAAGRVRALAEFTRNHTAPGRGDLSLAQHELACAILAALDQPGPA